MLKIMLAQSTKAYRRVRKICQIPRGMLEGMVANGIEPRIIITGIKKPKNSSQGKLMERQNCLMILFFYYIGWLCHYI